MEKRLLVMEEAIARTKVANSQKNTFLTESEAYPCAQSNEVLLSKLFEMWTSAAGDHEALSKQDKIRDEPSDSSSFFGGLSCWMTDDDKEIERLIRVCLA